MNTIRVSATHARNNLFDLLDQVSKGLSVIIEKDNKTVARVIPIMNNGAKYRGITKALNKASKNFSYSKNENPLRKSGALKFLSKRFGV